MALRLSNGVALRDRAELFVKHRLKGLRLEVEQDGPCFRVILSVDIDEVQLVNI